MRELYWIGDAPGTGRKQRLAYVWAENSEEAMEAANLWGINPSEDRCVEASNPEYTPERFIGRLLSDADCAELDQIRRSAMQGQAGDTPDDTITPHQ